MPQHLMWLLSVAEDGQPAVAPATEVTNIISATETTVVVNNAHKIIFGAQANKGASFDRLISRLRSQPHP